MSRHEGVSCDSCLKGNFRGRRFKCLICYDYDLCSDCYEANAATSNHTREHPMQCILTRTDYDLYYGGEPITNETAQAYCCPYCGKLGFTEQLLTDHVSCEHTDSTMDVICPVCAALPVGDPNLMTDDLAGHLTLEHHNASRDLISFLDEPNTIMRPGVRRMASQQTARRGGSRRSNLQNSAASALASSSSALVLSPSTRDNIDPIAELLSQLTGVRRSHASTPSQLQHLHMQLQLERQQAARQQIERLPRRSGPSSTHNNVTTTTTASIQSASTSSSNDSAQLVLPTVLKPRLTEAEMEENEKNRADRSFFTQELLLAVLSGFALSDKQDEDSETKDTEQSSFFDRTRPSTSLDDALIPLTPPVSFSPFSNSSDNITNSASLINFKDLLKNDLVGEFPFRDSLFPPGECSSHNDGSQLPDNSSSTDELNSTTSTWGTECNVSEKDFSNNDSKSTTSADD